MVSRRGWLGRALGGPAARKLRTLIPPLTTGLILRAIAGLFLFFCGIVLAIWLIIRFRRQVQDGPALTV